MFPPVTEQLEFDFEFACPYIEAQYYRDGAQDLIQRLVPAEFLETRGVVLSSMRTRFTDMLPLISWSDLSKAPCALSVLMLCKYRHNVSHFFYDMIGRWLLPQKRVNVELFFTSDVHLPNLSDDLFTVAEIVVHLKSAQDVEEVRRNLHAIETEIRLGVVSNYHARRILEFKGLSADGKTAMIQEKIGSLIQNHSKDFDSGIFSQMQHFLVTCKEEFKKARDYHHISRIISTGYSVRKLLKQNLQVEKAGRQVIVKFFKTRLCPTAHKEKEVLGILVGLNFLREHEVFEASHLIGALQKQIAQIRLVEGSPLIDRADDAPLQNLYLEVEKEDGALFSHDEIQLLREQLPDLIRQSIEQLAHPIFMPRNEEEVLRNIMSLSRQLRYVSDQPQISVSFDEQKSQELCFTITMVRVQGESAPKVQELFSKTCSKVKFHIERVRQVGQLRRRYTKEATVLRALLSSRDFLRADHSVDLYRAREQIVRELSAIVGSVRDYNGGMICKQSEALRNLKNALGRTADHNPLLVEKYFYALAPMELRSVIEMDSLKQLFVFLLQVMKSSRSRNSAGVFKQESKRVFALIPQVDAQQRKKLAERLEKLALPNHQLVSFYLDWQDVPVAGYLLLSEDRPLQESFLASFLLV